MERVVEAAPGRTLRIVEGDITRIAVDAIVNAANARLLGGSGVDGAIHRAGGPEIMRELDAMRRDVAPLPPGGAAATTAGRLPARFVFHTAGPVWRGGGGGESEGLRQCYRTCLQMAEKRGCETVSFPAISTGVYGYPADEAGRIAIGEVRRFLASDAKVVREVVFVQFGREAFSQLAALLDDTGPDHP